MQKKLKMIKKLPATLNSKLFEKPGEPTEKPFQTIRLDKIKAFSENMRDDDIYILVRILADKIAIDRTLELIMPEKPPYNSQELIMSEKLPYNSQDLFNSLLCKNTGDIVFKETKKGKVITCESIHRERELVIDVIKDPLIKWEQKETIHGISVYLPIGVSITYNGNHSIASGMLKRDGGKIRINDMSNVFDISPLIDYMYFDGVNYNRKKDETTLFEAGSFEFGCIFELGRIIMDRRISFSASRLERV